MVHLPAAAIGFLNTTESKSSGRGGLWAALVPLFLVVAAYQQTVFAGFVWDDHVLIEDAPHVQALQPVSSYWTRMFWSDPLDPSRAFYRPLVTLSYALEWQLWDGLPAGFHLTNLFAHLLVCALLYLFARRAGAQPLIAGAGTALFGLLPRLTESVAWVSGRTDVFAALFVFAALLVAARGPVTTMRGAAIAVLIGLGLFCKEVAIAAVPAVLIIARHGEPLAVRRRSTLTLGATLALMLGLYAGLRLYARSQELSHAIVFVRADLSIPERAVAALAAIGHYALMGLDPLRPSIQIGQLRQPTLAMTVLGIVSVAAVAILLFKFRRRVSRFQIASLAGAGTALVLVVHLVPLDVTVLAADRFLYLPAAFLTVGLAPALQTAYRRRRRATLAVVSVLVASFGVATHLQTRLWADEYALWQRAVDQRSPGSSGVLLALASLLMDSELYERALPYLERAVEEEAGFPQVKTHTALAVVLDKLGRRKEAISLLERIANQQPGALRPRSNLVMLYARDGRFEDAHSALAALREFAPGWPAVALIEAQLGAARMERAAIDRDPALSRVERSFKEALLAESLGARPEASAGYWEVLRSPEASGEQRLRAAAFFALHASPEQGIQAIDEARRGGVPEPSLAPLIDAASDRDRLY